jgi:transcriptional repressor NrdR
VRKACQGRPVTDADLAGLAQRVEENIRATGVSQIDANEIGLTILPELRTIDSVAYLRFASVYQAFDSLDDFESAISVLRRDENSKAESD